MRGELTDVAGPEVSCVRTLDVTVAAKREAISYTPAYPPKKRARIRLSSFNRGEQRVERYAAEGEVGGTATFTHPGSRRSKAL